MKKQLFLALGVFTLVSALSACQGVVPGGSMEENGLRLSQYVDAI